MGNVWTFPAKAVQPFNLVLRSQQAAVASDLFTRLQQN
jgi:hypothetical protein